MRKLLDTSPWKGGREQKQEPRRQGVKREDIEPQLQTSLLKNLYEKQKNIRQYLEMDNETKIIL